ncbi:hypothetical protein GOX01_24360 [Gluconobacter oxydans]|uniref:Uncharacterized protein n=1 Tax=Gluconobacter oxydans TaxID=442 RepID=A0AB35AUD8_GLUOY|nr:hypothetical protein [Gluconobacter oxydans]MBF0857531.1 hypothetical protein [Gluconobacter oxydans]TCW19394.1 hypothetical protein EDC20_1691 [Gluconobacter oxydans]GEC62105.1 hypothetical protein GOX01_24360 [Gluconobacter oxydans]
MKKFVFALAVGMAPSLAFSQPVSSSSSQDTLAKAQQTNPLLRPPANTNNEMLDGTQRVTTANGITQPLSSLLEQQINVANYGATAGSADSGAAVRKALTTATNRFPVYFPYSPRGYTINSGNYNGREIGTWLLNGNVISGKAIGSPATGAGTLISPYTNPYLITTDRKSVYDPAAIPQGRKGATIAESIECLPNRPNRQNENTNRNWIACRYVGADTGSGGTSSLDLSTEVENWVLNVSGNHGLAFEIDTNFNAAVTDGQWTTGLFLTGGGAKGRNVNSVALSIMHAAYDGSWLPWTTGISIRETTNQIQQYKTSAAESGFFQQAFDENGKSISWLDKMGNQTSQIMNAKNGFISDAPSGHDDYSAKRQTTTDTGFFFHALDEHSNTLASIDKEGNATVAGFVNTNHTKETASANCTRGEMHADDEKLYICVSTGKYKSVPLQEIH